MGVFVKTDRVGEAVARKAEVDITPSTLITPHIPKPAQIIKATAITPGRAIDLFGEPGFVARGVEFFSMLLSFYLVVMPCKGSFD